MSREKWGKKEYWSKTEKMVDGLVFCSAFDSGNLKDVVRRDDGSYGLYITADCENMGHTEYRKWFYFRVENVEKGMLLSFTTENIKMKKRNIYRRPVFRESGAGAPQSSGYSSFARIRDPVRYSTNTRNIDEYGEYHLHFRHRVLTDCRAVYFAMTFPWSYCDSQRSLATIDRAIENYDSTIYYHRTTLTYTLDNRKMDLLTITTNVSKRDQEAHLPFNHIFPDGNIPQSFPDKPVVIITARVHPGEVPGSHVFNGVLDFLLDREDLRAKALRDNFVFLLVPMLNPDGVARGHYRQDQLNKNLNRYYSYPTREKQPTLFAIRQLIKRFKTILYYIDLHAHNSKRGTFLIGNQLYGSFHVQNLIFAKMLSMNTVHVDFNKCQFNSKVLASYPVPVGKKAAKMNKGGTARVAIHNLIGVTKCFTLEMSYNCSKAVTAEEVQLEKIKNPELIWETIPATNESPEHTVIWYTPPVFHRLAKDLLITILDCEKLNPASKLSASHDEIKVWCYDHMMKLEKRRSKRKSKGKKKTRRDDYNFRARQPSRSRALPPYIPRKDRSKSVPVFGRSTNLSEIPSSVLSDLSNTTSGQSGDSTCYDSSDCSFKNSSTTSADYTEDLSIGLKDLLTSGTSPSIDISSSFECCTPHQEEQTRSKTQPPSPHSDSASGRELASKLARKKWKKAGKSLSITSSASSKKFKKQLSKSKLKRKKKKKSRGGSSSPARLKRNKSKKAFA